jgi:hypothetical protein
MQRALDFMAPYKIPSKDAKPEGLAGRPLTAAEQIAAEQVRNYKAEDMLQDRAFKDAKKITPATLVKAYGELQDDLRRKMEQDPGNPLYQAQAVKLQESFVHVTNSLDYVEANAKRGVDIMKKEGLSRFMLEQDPNAAPAVEKQEKPRRNGAPPKMGIAAKDEKPAEPPRSSAGSLRQRPMPGM